MASIFDSFFGQQDAPTLNTPSVRDILGVISQSLPKLAQINDQWNMSSATGGAKAQLAGEKIYDPNRATIRGKAGSLLSSELDNPYGLPPAIAALLRQQGFEGSVGSGLSTSDAGRAGVSSLLGEKALQYGQGIISQGLGYGANTANLYNPQSAITPSDVGNTYSAGVTQQNSINKYLSDLNFQNSMNLINRPLDIGGKLGNIAGQIVGGVFGTNMGGSMFGGGSAPQISPGTYGGAGQPSWETLNWALPGRGG